MYNESRMEQNRTKIIKRMPCMKSGIKKIKLNKKKSLNEKYVKIAALRTRCMFCLEVKTKVKRMNRIRELNITIETIEELIQMYS